MSAPKLYQLDKTIRFAVEANSRGEAQREIAKLIIETAGALPVGVTGLTRMKAVDLHGVYRV